MTDSPLKERKSVSVGAIVNALHHEEGFRSSTHCLFLQLVLCPCRITSGSKHAGYRFIAYGVAAKPLAVTFLKCGRQARTDLERHIASVMGDNPLRSRLTSAVVAVEIVDEWRRPILYFSKAMGLNRPVSPSLPYALDWQSSTETAFNKALEDLPTDIFASVYAYLL